MCNII
jgi:3-hydroxyisobutyryl-CoA hydrolase